LSRIWKLRSSALAGAVRPVNVSVRKSLAWKNAAPLPSVPVVPSDGRPHDEPIDGNATVVSVLAGTHIEPDGVKPALQLTWHVRAEQ
jgi:hypothetical protein